MSSAVSTSFLISLKLLEDEAFCDRDIYLWRNFIKEAMENIVIAFTLGGRGNLGGYAKIKNAPLPEYNFSRGLNSSLNEKI